MKGIALIILTTILVLSTVISYGEKLSGEIGENIIRLHVVAESNCATDQKVKIKVRDRVLKLTESIETKGELKKKLSLIENEANCVLKEEGFDYTAKAEYGVFEFPTKYYDGFALPKGEYEAVKIVLGEGKGENWWCVLFPPLCMVEGATEEQTELLKETFGKNYSLVTDKKPVFNIKFKLAELF